MKVHLEMVIPDGKYCGKKCRYLFPRDDYSCAYCTLFQWTLITDNNLHTRKCKECLQLKSLDKVKGK